MHSTLNKLLDAVGHMVDGFIGRLPALILGIIVFAAFYFLSRFVARAIRRAVLKKRQNLAVVFSRLTGGTTVLLGMLVAISVIAPSFQASDLIKVLGIGGVAIGFAFQNILQNFLAGLLLLWSEPFRVGDEIKLDVFEGKVEEIQTRATIIKTYDERRVVIPNAELFTRSVIVNTALASRRWQYDLIVPRKPLLDTMKNAIVEAVRGVPDVLTDPAPEVLATELNPDSVKLRVLWSTRQTGEHQMLSSYDKVLTTLDAVFNQELQTEEQQPTAA